MDSLYVGYYVRVPEEVLDVLADARAQAEDTGDPAEVHVGGETFTVSAYGIRPYRYTLRNSDVIVCVGKRNRDNYPMVYVHFLCEYLWREGPWVAVDRVRAWVRQLAGGDYEREVCSRIDLAVDFTGWKPGPEHFAGLVTRAVDIDMYSQHRRFTGFRIGKDQVVCRIYDKRAEIQRSGKTWFYDRWGVSQDSEDSVWRVEYQLRREAIKSMKFLDPATGELEEESVDQVLAAAGDVWRYLALDWCSLRVPNPGNPQRTRWEVYEPWRVIAEADWTPRRWEVMREHTTRSDLDQLVPMVVGCMSSSGAVIQGGIRNPRGFDCPEKVWASPEFQEALGRYWDRLERKGRAFERDVEVKSMQEEIMREGWADVEEDVGEARRLALPGPAP